MLALGGVRGATDRQSHDQVTWPDHAVAFEAVVASEVAERPKTMAMDLIICNNGRKIKAYIAKDHRSRLITIGNRLRVTAPIERNSNWVRGTFNYRRYQEVHGFSGRAFVKPHNWRQLALSYEGIGWWQQMRLRFLCFRQTLLQRYRKAGLENHEYAIVAAMTLGDKSSMTPALREVYNISGASHVLALSGLHLGIVYMFLTLITMNRRWRIFSQIVTLAGIWAFALLVGMPPSVLRSALMVTIYGLFSLNYNKPPSVNTLALTALIILLPSPNSLFDVGFQLSFLAMFAILTVQPFMQGLVPASFLLRHRLLRWLWGLTTVSIAAQLGTAPLVAYYFGRIATYALLTNMVAIPAVTVILLLAPIALFIPPSAQILMMTVRGFNSTLQFISTRLPAANIENLTPSAIQVLMVYVIIAALLLLASRLTSREASSA
jgi:competence protein ComEC